MARYKMPGSCPVCGDRLDVTGLACRSCSTAMTGSFEPCRFCRLSPEHLSFVEVFVKNRGNIREIERELGISYPTVRNRLDQVIAALGYSVRGEADEDAAGRDVGDAGDAGDAGVGPAADSRGIVEALSKGEISADEAVKLIKSRTR